MMLVPVLLVLGYAISRMRAKRSAEDSLAENDGRKGKISVPWFAFGFLGVIVFNSFVPLPSAGVDVINYADTFLLTMAMTALGMETDINKFKKAGPKPFHCQLQDYAAVLTFFAFFIFLAFIAFVFWEFEELTIVSSSIIFCAPANLSITNST